MEQGKLSKQFWNVEQWFSITTFRIKIDQTKNVVILNLVTQTMKYDLTINSFTFLH